MSCLFATGQLRPVNPLRSSRLRAPSATRVREKVTKYTHRAAAFGSSTSAAPYNSTKIRAAPDQTTQTKHEAKHAETQGSTKGVAKAMLSDLADGIGEEGPTRLVDQWQGWGGHGDGSESVNGLWRSGCPKGRRRLRRGGA